MSTKRSLRLIALFEALKGLLVLLAGCGLLALIHPVVQQAAERLVRQFHLNPANRVPRIFIEAVTKTNNTTLWLLASAAFAYAALRLCEAVGLWRQRTWAEWLGAVSGGIYIPIEIYELLHGVSWLKVTLLAVNTVCVAYLIYALRANRRNRSHGSTGPGG